MPTEKITVITEQNMVVCLTGIQKDVQYIKEKLDTSVDDHETRIRCLEQREEDCRQVKTFQGIQSTLNDHEIRINTLESVKDQDTGAEKARFSIRETILFVIAIFGWIFTIYQFLKGGL